MASRRTVCLPRASTASFEKVPDESNASLNEGHGAQQRDGHDGVHASDSVLAKWKAVEMLKVLQRHVFLPDDGMM